MGFLSFVSYGRCFILEGLGILAIVGILLTLIIQSVRIEGLFGKVILFLFVIR